MAEDPSARHQELGDLNRSLLTSISLDDLEDLDLQHIEMRTHSSNNREAHSSLDESNYELLSSSGIISDDEGNTVSVASQSVDGDTPDDFSSINDTEESEAENIEEEDDEHYEDETPIVPPVPTPSITEEDDVDESGMTVRPALDPFIKFYEAPLADGQLLVHHLPRTPSGETVEVEMSVSHEVGQLPQPFRILFVGDLYSYTGDFLIQHIAQALMVPHAPDSGSGHISVSPVPSVTSPQVFDIKPSSSMQIQVYLCVEAKGASRLILEDGSELRFQNGKMQILTCHHVERLDLPHLAVFLHDDQPRLLHDNATMKWTRTAAIANDIPTLDVALSGHFDSQPGFDVCDGPELHIRIEDHDAAFTPLSANHARSMPVDVLILSKIHPTLLNRHLAYLINHNKARTTEPATSAAQTASEENQNVAAANFRFLCQNIAANTRYLCENAHESIKPIVQRLWTNARFEQKAAVLGLLVMMVLPMLLPMFVTMSSNPVVVPQTPAPPAIKPTASSTALTKSASTSIEVPQEITKIVQIETPPVDVSIRTIIEKSLGPPQVRLESKRDVAADKFTAERISSTVFSITPPSVLTNLKKFSPSAVSIKVRRGSEPVPIKLATMTKPNVWFAVELEPKDAHGLLSVLISFNGKPKIVENLTVDFGNSWLRVPSWSNALDFMPTLLRWNAEMAELSFKSLQKLKEETQEMREQMSKKGRDAADKAMKELQASAKSLIKQANKDVWELSKQVRREMKAQQRTTKELIQRTNELTTRAFGSMELMCREVGEAYVDTMKTLTEMVQKFDLGAPVRKSKSLKHAAANAREIASKVARRDKERAKNGKEKWKKVDVLPKRMRHDVPTGSGGKVYATQHPRYSKKPDCQFRCTKFENGYAECEEKGTCPRKVKSSLIKEMYGGRIPF